MVAYVHIEYSTCQFSEESKGGGGWIPCGTEKSVVLRGLKGINSPKMGMFNERRLGIRSAQTP